MLAASGQCMMDSTMSRRTTSGGSKILAYGAPFVAFMAIGWYWLATVVESKRDLRSASKGMGAYEEMDPVERMRKQYGIGREASGGRSVATQEALPPIPSLEDELQKTLRQIDIKNFDYKPVPRTDEEDE